MIRTPFATYLMTSIPREGEAGAGAGGAAGSGAGAAGAAGAGAGAAGGGAAGAGAGAGQQGAWYESADYGFDTDTLNFYKGKNPPDLKTALTSWRHADQAARDRNVVAKPNPEKLAEWEGHELLGWKKDIKDYQVKKPALKQGQVLDEAMFNSFTQDAHELRIPLPAAQALFEKQFGKAYERIAAMDAAGAKSTADLQTALKEKWGDGYEAETELSKRAMRAFGVGMDDSAELEKMIGSPRMVELFNGLGKKLGEDKLVDGGNNNAQTPAAARSQRLALEGDPEWIKVFNNARDPRNKDYVAQRARLIEIEATKK